MWLFSSVVERCPEEAGVPSSNLGGATKEILSSKDGSLSFLNPNPFAFYPRSRYTNSGYAGVAQLLERILAKDEVQG